MIRSVSWWSDPCLITLDMITSHHNVWSHWMQWYWVSRYIQDISINIKIFTILAFRSIQHSDLANKVFVNPSAFRSIFRIHCESIVIYRRFQILYITSHHNVWSLEIRRFPVGIPQIPKKESLNFQWKSMNQIKSKNPWNSNEFPMNYELQFRVG